MIIYEDYNFGFRNLLRVHGSPVYKVVFPSLCSTGFLVLLDYLASNSIDDEPDDPFDRILVHPYALGALIGFFSFLLAFRLNQAYQRYWEGATTVHQMLSKWVDTAMLMAAFHYQASSFDRVKPPAFGNNPHAMAVDLQRQRIQNNATSLEETLASLQRLQEQDQQQQQPNESEPPTKPTFWSGLRRRRRRRGRHPHAIPDPRPFSNHSARSTESGARVQYDINTNTKVVARVISGPHAVSTGDESSKIPIPLRFQERFQVIREEEDDDETRSDHTNTTPLSSTPTQTLAMSQHQHFAAQRSMSIIQSRAVRMPAPSLFSQELAHLVSLLTGVALSSLRNDLEGCEAPIKEYIPGKPWPPVNPDELSKDERRKYGAESRFWQMVYFCLGLSRSERQHTLYNAARPFLVLGGISDHEVQGLHRARGPSARVALCTLWLKEFISREILHGSVGQSHHALLSRLYQYVSDGGVGYNQARKIAYTPFPFPHGQMTTFFVIIVVFLLPAFFQGYVNRLWLACFLNFWTVECFLGIHEVARELENPFSNVPNDLPLTTFQAQVNESLVTMYAGYHPDAWWKIVAEKEEKKVIIEVDDPNDKKQEAETAVP
mmetsp:Transcript_8811/g.24386  ORF Transcript_8811/g.24386 Transcript_8811/m.24386 type:complete len:604 (+) Transcript_8811:119-1930(+)|eukprot:CAMPEP_0168729054 /NCGR_PEP_ID=MMETSP0724-20121128/6000_1 /TAXON_ID=265536 /ORGANISM="Amphiprora sp., Strain CCMP467" /LENGTH=603 /DNA_ID=CAMNT_0008775915 /DNA_START=39 /DNA_END=1850 /DNA_ORIENTATION=-